jgi:hypothetical protein
MTLVAPTVDFCMDPKKIKEALGAERLPFPLIRSLVEIYYDFQDQRIITSNRINRQSATNGITDEQLEKYGVKSLLHQAESFENNVKAMLTAQVPLHPIYTEHLSRIYGIGPVISTGLIAYVGDISKFDNIRRAW